MDETQEPSTEDLAQLLQRVTAEKGLTQLEISRRSGIARSTINAWATRSRATGRGPSRAKLEALAAATGEPKDVVFAAADRKTPGYLSPNQEERLLEFFRELTEDQQGDKLGEIEYLAKRNRAGS